jgi:hypothetical protein
MKTTIQKQIGKSLIRFEVDEPKAKDALFMTGVLASTPDKCTLCNSEDVSLEGNKNSGYTFIKVTCKKCFAQAQLGDYKDGGHFWKKFEKYEKDTGDADVDIPFIEE